MQNSAETEWPILFHSRIFAERQRARVCRVNAVRFARYVLYSGAPEEIRTPDPQIRSLDQFTDLARFSCKPSVKARTRCQRVSYPFANHNRLLAGLSRSKLARGNKPGWTHSNTRKHWHDTFEDARLWARELVEGGR